MKKALFTLAIIVASVTLTSFVINKQNSSSDEWSYVGTYTAYYEGKDATQIYVYYKEDTYHPGTRVYGYSFESGRYPVQSFVRRNKEYKKGSGVKSQFRYVADCCWYFNIKNNGELPRMGTTY